MKICFISPGSLHLCSYLEVQLVQTCGICYAPWPKWCYLDSNKMKYNLIIEGTQSTISLSCLLIFFFFSSTCLYLYLAYSDDSTRLQNQQALRYWRFPSPSWCNAVHIGWTKPLIYPAAWWSSSFCLPILRMCQGSIMSLILDLLLVCWSEMNWSSSSCFPLFKDGPGEYLEPNHWPPSCLLVGNELVIQTSGHSKYEPLAVFAKSIN